MGTIKDIDLNTIPCAPRISQGFEQLASILETDTESTLIDFDVVIIGSGYGGAIAAAHLANQCHSNGDPVSVCILERGSEYLPGMFPSREADLAGHIRFSREHAKQAEGRTEGLFDIRMGKDINVVLGNGLGGGSLINAGVMEIPNPEVFDAHWPKDINSEEMTGYFTEAKKLLGGSRKQLDNTIKAHPEHCQNPLQKYQALKKFSKNNLTDGKFRDAAITVGMKTAFNREGVLIKQCTLCGDCATGCNHGAKESLDVNLLARAERLGAAIYTGATVLTVEPANNQTGWDIDVSYTDKILRQRQGNYRMLRGARVILAAGTLGSTEILQRSSNEKGLTLSQSIGSKFSGNGDSISTGYHQKTMANAVARETEQPDQRRVGPTITGIIDLRENTQTPYVIEELAVPGPLRRIFEELNTTAKTLQDLDSFDWSNHSSSQPRDDPFSVNPKAISNSSIYAVMARDNAEGELSLPPLKEGQKAHDGTIHINGSTLSKDPVYQQQLAKLQEMLKRSKIGGRIIANPLWKLLPDSMASLIDNQQGSVISVHPLGGCPMGDNPDKGVVDQYGQVFDASSSDSSLHDGLLVLDGSIIPAALGTNPALTIAALSLRAISTLSSIWGFKERPSVEPAQRRQRAIIKDPSQPKPDIATEVELIERLSGNIKLQNLDGSREIYVAELTLCFEEKKLRQLTQLNKHGKPGKRFFKIPATTADSRPPSTVHIYTREVWRQLQASNATQRLPRSSWDQGAELVLAVHGKLELFPRQKSYFTARTAKALYDYLVNRGLRDIHQHCNDTEDSNGPGPVNRFLSLLKLASHAGEARLLNYRLKLTESAKPTPETRLDTRPFKAGQAICGTKTLSYQRRANPWHQLMQVSLVKFPGFTDRRKNLWGEIIARLPMGSPTDQAILTLDTNYLVGNGIPLMRIAKQQDEPTALAELASFGAYTLRMLISIHLWTFRKPDRSKSHSRNRLPGKIAGLPSPIAHNQAIDHIAGMAITIRLTHYPQKHENTEKKPPVLLIHGYSASGSTYTHRAIKPNLAQELYQDGRDVWVLDCRSSIGWDGSNGYLKTADLPWTFEDMAFADIPFAVEYVVNKTKRKKIDIVAHCMGAAMLSMAILSDGAVSQDQQYRQSLGGGKRKAYPEALAALPSRINKLVLSQVGPLIIFSPANVMRAYLMSFMRHYLPSDQYSFNPELDPVSSEDDVSSGKLANDLLDRLLYSLPYPDEDYDIENPVRPTAQTGFTGTRHRMDALYGRTFSLKNFPPELLDHIDDIFGPLNITTLSQVIHLANHQTLGNYLGNNEFVSRAKLQKYWTFPTLHIHGEENGLADPKTLLRMDYFLKAAGIKLESQLIKNCGHQDSLMGKSASLSFDRIKRFLSHPTSTPTAEPAVKDKGLIAILPATGPVIGIPAGGEIPLRLGARPGLDDPIGLCFIPVKRTSGEHQGQFSVVHNGYLSNEDNVVEFIVNSIKLVELSDNNDRWHKLMAPWLLESEPLADGILTLFIYEDFNDPHNASFDINRSASQDYRQKSAKAVARLLQERSANYLEKGLIEYRQADQGDQLSLAFASCQYPPGILYNNLAYQSWRRLSLKLDDKQSPTDLLLLLGDQIYSDPTAGLFDPTSKENLFDHPYQRWLHHQDVRSVLRRLPSCMMLDDHEIRNNWVKGSPEPDNNWRFEEGVKAYIRYQRQENLQAGQPLWMAFQKNGFAFFMTDTRTGRALRNASNIEQKPIITEQQFSALGDWIKTNKSDDGKPMFISSAAILLPRHILSIADNRTSAIRSDSWDGYPASLHRLLAQLADEQVNNVIFLSGDEHLAAVARISIRNHDTGHRAVTHSIHSSSLHAPFPFANGQPEQFQNEECFSFHYSKESSQPSNLYECSVTTEIVMTGDGFTLLRANKQQGRWQLECTFDRESNANTVTIPISMVS